MIKKTALLSVAFLFIFMHIIFASSDFQRGELEEGQSIMFNISNGFYILTLVSVSDHAGSVIFRLNSEMTGRLDEKESYKFNDGSEIVVREIIGSSAAEGMDSAGYYFYASGNNPMNVKLHSLNPDVCNFDRKCGNENKNQCCYDCGCEAGYNCINNTCRGEECKKNPECNDFDACTADRCSDGKCEHAESDGCELSDECVEEGYTSKGKYCKGSEWVAQKKGDELCSYSYECESSKCENGKCAKKTGSKAIILIVVAAMILLAVAYTKRERIIRRIKWKVI